MRLVAKWQTSQFKRKPGEEEPSWDPTCRWGPRRRHDRAAPIEGQSGDAEQTCEHSPSHTQSTKRLEPCLSSAWLGRSSDLAERGHVQTPKGHVQTHKGNHA